MDTGTIVMLAGTVVCFVIAIILLAKKVVPGVFAPIFMFLGLLCLTAAVSVQHKANNTSRDNREATAQVEAQSHVKVVHISTDGMTVRYTQGNMVCDGSLLHYNSRWLLATNATCAKLAS